MRCELMVILLLGTCHDKIAEGLGQEYLDLIAHLMEQSPKCVTLLYKLDRIDYEVVSEKFKSPLLMVDDKNIDSKAKIQLLLSAKQSSCALVFLLEQTLDVNVIEYLLNQTKHRVVYVMTSKRYVTQNNFQPYFRPCITFILPFFSGNLQIGSEASNTSNPTIKAIWQKKGKKMLTLKRGILNLNMDRERLRNQNVTVSVVPYPPFVTLLPNKKVVGIEIDTFKVVAEKMGFHYTLKLERFWVLRNPKTGVLELEKGSSSFGSIVSGRSQFGLFLVMVNNFDAILPTHFSPVTYDMDFSYLVPKPGLLKPFSNFVRPFSVTVWAYLLASWVGFSVMAFIFNKYHGDPSMTLLRITLDLFGTTWQQKLRDSLVSPSSGVYCIMFGLWIIGMTFKGAAYSCNLRAFMVMKDYEKPIDTDQDIIDRNVDLYIAQGAGLVEEYQTSLSPLKRQIAARTIARKTAYSLSDKGIVGPAEERMVREGGVRLSFKARNFYVLQGFEKHYGYQPLQVAKTPPMSWAMVTGMPLNQPWSDEVDRIYLQLLAAGIVDKFWRRYIPEENTGENDDDDLEPYKIDHVVGPLIALASGLALSILVACMEIGHFHKDLIMYFEK